MADKNLQAEVDRWRRKLLDADRELAQKGEHWRRAQEIFFQSLHKFSQAMGAIDDEAIQDAITALRKSSLESVDVKAMESAFVHLTHALLEFEIPLNDKPQSAPAPTSAVDLASNQLCAMLVSEILLQLLESISLPLEVSARIERLKQSFDVGAQNGRWDDMFDEVATMATDIKSKINTERADTENFLKQITDRLQELDKAVTGAQNSRQQTLKSGSALDDAVRQEMRHLQTGMDQTNDLAVMKQLLQQRLVVIEKHFSEFRERELKQHSMESDVIASLKQRLAEVEAETTKLRERIQKEREAAQTDALTAIPNRLGYLERIGQEFARWKRFKQPLCLVVWDVDKFKTFNDNYGHAVGDRVLKAIAKQLHSKIRETDYLARYGGEEFVLIMPGANRESARSVADKLRMAVEAAPFHFKGEPVKVTISCGVAEFHGNDTIESVFERADEALYKAKEAGRNRVVVA